MDKKKYYQDLDFIRLIACVAVFLYHLNILKGGYLAVCMFFTLSGYLSCVSLLEKDKLSFLKYYINKLKKLYLPLLAVVSISVLVISFIKSINWFNFKPETISVLFGYNNFWQINANLDYFAKHVDSPFMHLWYMGILLQFDLVFPFVYIILKKIGDKLHKSISIIIPIILSIGSFIYFYMLIKSGSITAAYYNTFSRVYSLLLGVSLAFISYYYKPLVIKKDSKVFSRIILFVYLIILFVMFVYVKANSKYFICCMALSSLVTMRLIDYGTVYIKEKLNFLNKIVKSLSGISYEIYLVQYPVIFIFQYIKIGYKVPLIILITVVISFVLHYSLQIKKSKSVFGILRYICFGLTMIVVCFGLYKIVTAKDYSDEMKNLETQLNQNEEEMKKRQKEFEQRKKEEQEKWDSVLKDLDKAEESLPEYVKNLNIVGIGDSVMLNALTELYKVFPKGYFDAAVNRTDWELNPILVNLKGKNMLGDVVLLNLGTNGECPQSCKTEYMNSLGDRTIFWVNATHPDFAVFNPNLEKFAEKHKNVKIIDWVSACKGHSEYLVADGTHLTPAGKVAYAKTVYQAIFDYYKKDLEKQKEEKLKEKESLEKGNITFFGNDLLLNIYNDIQAYYKDSEFVIKKDYNTKSLIEDLEKKIHDKSLSNNVVFIFDKTANINYEQVQSICKDYNIYIVLTNKNSISDKENLSVINIYDEILSNSEYVMVDGVHLTDKGNKKLIDIVNNKLNEKK